MTHTLKATVAVIALTAGSAWAQTAATGDVAGSVSADTGASVSAGADQSSVDVNTDTNTSVKQSAQTSVAADGDTTNTDLKEAEAETDTLTGASDTANSVSKPASDNVAEAEASASSSQTATTTTDTMVDSFSGMVASDIVGLNVVEANGEDIGEIDTIVRYNGELAAIIGVGGFLGFGEHEVAIPLSEISRAAEGDLKLSTRTNAELEAMAEVDEAEYEKLDADAPLDSGV